MSNGSYKVGKFAKIWRDGDTQLITFIVTEDCNLRCKYCYITHKASNKKMSFVTAKKFIDYILSADINRMPAVILEFIGGEPFLEVELIDRICDYFKVKTFEKGDKWYWNYRISICTNGVNYSNDAVQKFISKNTNKMSLSITVDGIKEKHDLQRVFENGTGSYNVIENNIPLWLKTFKPSTKVTFASEDLKYLKDSIVSLWEKGIWEVAANVVFENVWNKDDDLLFENQLKALADHVLDNQLYDKYLCTLFDESIGFPYRKGDLKKTSCGAGKMMALGPDGKIYPCLRYKDFSLDNQPERIIGDIENGIDMDRVRPFMTAMTKFQSDEECLNCDIAKGCAFCQGFNYDNSESGTNFHRTKYICKMHKARVRANNYYFAKLHNRFGVKREVASENKRLYFVLNDNFVDFCTYRTSAKNNHMTEECIMAGLEYAAENFFKPFFLHSKETFCFDDLTDYEAYSITHLVPAEFSEKALALKNVIFVFDSGNIDLPLKTSNCFLNVEQSDILNLYEYVAKLLKKTDRININILNTDLNFNTQVYREQLLEIKSLIVDLYKNYDEIKEISSITDLCHINEHNNCKAGDKSFAYAPNGKIYTCPITYLLNKDNYIGDITEGITIHRYARLYKISNSPLCGYCDAYQCLNCVLKNKSSTGEVNVSPSYQCIKSHIEREISRQYQREIDHEWINEIDDISYDDPVQVFIKDAGVEYGYYNFNK